MGGENGDKDSSHPTFHDLMHAKEKNMAAITQYLMARKGEGRPLTADEDQQLQKFYYNRASTILKKIVLLKQGQRDEASVHHSQERSDEAAVDGTITTASEHADAVVERLRFDAKVA